MHSHKTVLFFLSSVLSLVSAAVLDPRQVLHKRDTIEFTGPTKTVFAVGEQFDVTFKLRRNGMVFFGMPIEGWIYNKHMEERVMVVNTTEYDATYAVDGLSEGEYTFEVYCPTSYNGWFDGKWGKFEQHALVASFDFVVEKETSSTTEITQTTTTVSEPEATAAVETTAFEKTSMASTQNDVPITTETMKSNPTPTGSSSDLQAGGSVESAAEKLQFSPMGLFVAMVFVVALFFA